MRPRGEKVCSSVDPDGKTRSLAEEKPKIDVEKKKSLTFKFEFDKKGENFELTPLSEKQLIKKLSKGNDNSTGI